MILRLVKLIEVLGFISRLNLRIEARRPANEANRSSPAVKELGEPVIVGVADVGLRKLREASGIFQALRDDHVQAFGPLKAVGIGDAGGADLSLVGSVHCRPFGANAGVDGVDLARRSSGRAFPCASGRAAFAVG